MDASIPEWYDWDCARFHTTLQVQGTEQFASRRAATPPQVVSQRAQAADTVGERRTSPILVQAKSLRLGESAHLLRIYRLIQQLQRPQQLGITAIAHLLNRQATFCHRNKRFHADGKGHTHVGVQSLVPDDASVRGQPFLNRQQ